MLQKNMHGVHFLLLTTLCTARINGASKKEIDMSKTEKTKRFHNISDHELADMFGNIKQQHDHIGKGLDEIKDELKRRLDGDGVIEAAKFTVTVATSYATRIDTKKLRDVLGDAIKEVETTSESVRVTVKPTVIFGGGE